MKETTITCDHCEAVLNDYHIELGTVSGDKLRFENTMNNQQNGNLKSLGNHDDLHFCSKQHFIDFFFNRI
jgi:phosphosulfolactate phosphohydrolase-like enzyme